jgi:HK97 family phage portal protein
MIDFLGSIFGVTSDESAKWWPAWGISRKTAAGTNVGPSSALGLPAYYACVRVLAEDAAKLPLKIYREQPDGSKMIETEHPASRILRRVPNRDQTPFTVRETLTAWAAGWGNGYAEIVRDNTGKLQELALIHPSRVTIKRIDGQVVYVVRSDIAGMEAIGLLPNEVFHIHGLGDGLSGFSVARIGAESIGAAMAAETFVSTFYGNNTAIGGTLKHPGKLTDVARANLRESWQQMHGGPDNAHKVAILEEGVEYAATSVSPRDAQFIEGRQFDVETVCRWFRMPPHKVQHLLRATFTNIESQGIEYVTDTLIPWLTRWEQEINRKLIGEDETLYAKHEVNGLMRGDAQARGQFYSQLFQIGVLTVNEIRRLEDIEPSKDPAADKHFVQGALVPIGDAGKSHPSAPIKIQTGPEAKP